MKVSAIQQLRLLLARVFQPYGIFGDSKHAVEESPNSKINGIFLCYSKITAVLSSINMLSKRYIANMCYSDVLWPQYSYTRTSSGKLKFMAVALSLIHI